MGMDILPYKKIPIDSKFLQKTKVCNLSCDTTLFVYLLLAFVYE